MTKIKKNLCVAVAAFFSGPSIAASFTDAELVESRSGVVTSAPHSNMLQLNRAINGGPIFAEDFQGMAIPAGWVLVDVDGQTPYCQRS